MADKQRRKPRVPPRAPRALASAPPEAAPPAAAAGAGGATTVGLRIFLKNVIDWYLKISKNPTDNHTV